MKKRIWRAIAVEIAKENVREIRPKAFMGGVDLLIGPSQNFIAPRRLSGDAGR
jgi:hypothetical protein